jgi:hypothetical protein
MDAIDKDFCGVLLQAKPLVSLIRRSDGDGITCFRGQA